MSLRTLIMRNHILRSSALVIAFVLLPHLVFSQSSAREIGTKLKGHPLFLRGQWSTDDLTFDLLGQPVKKYDVTTFTLCGIDVSSVKQKDNRLEIKGQRVGLEFSATGQMRRVAIKTPSYSGEIRITVNGPDGSNYDPAIDAIFAPDLSSLAGQMPPYWQYYAKYHFAAQPVAAVGGQSAPSSPNDISTFHGDSPASLDSTDRVLHVGGEIKPPAVISGADPRYNNVARELRYEGVTSIYLWSHGDGSTSNYSVVKPIGMGLDEAALAAVQKYKFDPATQGGKPVTVDLYIDVNFQIR